MKNRASRAKTLFAYASVGAFLLASCARNPTQSTLPSVPTSAVVDGPSIATLSDPSKPLTLTTESARTALSAHSGSPLHFLFF